MKELSVQDRALLAVTERIFYGNPDAVILRQRVEAFAKDRDSNKFINDLAAWQEKGMNRADFYGFRDRADFADFCYSRGIVCSDGRGTKEYIEENWRLFNETATAFEQANVKTALAGTFDDELGLATIMLVDISSLRTVVGNDYRVIAKLWGDWFEAQAESVKNIYPGYYLLSMKMAEMVRSVLNK